MRELGEKARFIEVKVKPNARTSALHRESDGTWRADLQAPPADGKANAELIALVAKAFGCARSAVSIKTGAGRRTKLVKIEGRSKQPVEAVADRLR